mmetsp:Transcript_143641/g.261354  ORF Transcript_143641/g.261354 Transcript_143641/m.261354 type:complete len:121 (+) Transcript_143641:96-458(+)
MTVLIYLQVLRLCRQTCKTTSFSAVSTTFLRAAAASAVSACLLKMTANTLSAQMCYKIMESQPWVLWHGLVVAAGAMLFMRSKLEEDLKRGVLLSVLWPCKALGKVLVPRLKSARTWWND